MFERELAKPLVIIPAAGFGRRMGLPPAKELLLRPGTDEALIEAPLRWARERHWPVLVITRRDKQELLNYLESHHGGAIQVFLIEASQDWQQTILQAKDCWAERNLVLLPDTEFQPIMALDQLNLLLNDFDIVAGVHNVDDPENWGHLWPESSDVTAVVEKPMGQTMTHQAWGILGFRRNFGQSLLEAQWQSFQQRKVHYLNGRLGLSSLLEFKDLTRK